MKYIVSWAHELLSTNWTEQECETLEEAKELTKLRKAEGFVVLPVEKIKEEEAAPEAVAAIEELRAENEQLNARIEKAKQVYRSMKSEMNELREKNAQLEQRIENAKAVYLEIKRDISNTELRVKATIRRNTQKSRDVLYGLGCELHEYATKLKNNPDTPLTLVHVDNMQQFIAAIIENLEANGIYDPDDAKPDTSEV